MNKFFYDKDRCEVLAKYIIDTGSTVRHTAAHFGISKSTVHKDLSEKLKHINSPLYEMVQQIFELNKSERHIRGGEATRLKYLKKREVAGK